MAKANVDPDELRRFARDLKRFNIEMQGLMSALQARLHGLENSWRDQEHRKFAEEHTRAMKRLSQFMELSDQHVQFLNRKAGHIEEYLNSR